MLEALTQPRARRALRILVYVMLVSSAAAAFFLDEPLWSAARLGTLPEWTPLLPALLFTAFVLIFAVDRWVLVRKRKYPVSKAFFQVLFALVFLTLLWPEQASQFRRVKGAAGPPSTLSERLLYHRDPEVRAAACELAGLKAQSSALDRISSLAAESKNNMVRSRCQHALQRLQARSQP